VCARAEHAPSAAALQLAERAHRISSPEPAATTRTGPAARAATARRAPVAAWLAGTPARRPAKTGSAALAGLAAAAAAQRCARPDAAGAHTCEMCGERSDAGCRQASGIETHKEHTPRRRRRVARLRGGHGGAQRALHGYWAVRPARGRGWGEGDEARPTRRATPPTTALFQQAAWPTHRLKLRIDVTWRWIVPIPRLCRYPSIHLAPPAPPPRPPTRGARTRRAPARTHTLRKAEKGKKTLKNVSQPP
jgi:hypothetical protein